MKYSAKLKGAAACAVAAMGVIASQALAAPFAPGNLVVTQVGADGSGSALTSASTAVFLNEYNPLVPNVQVQQLALPTAASGANKPFTLSGSSTSEGPITLSTNGQYLTVAGYAVAPGTLSVSGTASSTVNRGIARIDLAGNIDTTTALTDAATAGNARSAVSTDGNALYFAGSTGGARYTTLGSTTSTQLATDLVNLRVLNIFGGQLYTSAMTGAFRGVNTIGSGIPTTGGQTTTLLTGFSSATNSPQSVYDYYFANATTLYVADDRSTTTANTGGLEKFTLISGTWTLAYTLTSGLGTQGLRGLAAFNDSSGNAVLYATTSDGLRVTTITDQISATTLPPTETFVTIATAPANTAFRGVDLAAVPEPTALGLGLVTAGLLLGRRPRRR